MAQTKDYAGYHRVHLCKKSKGYCRRTHRLVLESFVSLCPEGKEGCHRDDNKSNNALANLAWDEHGKNVRDSFKNGRVALRGSDTGRAKLNDQQVLEIRAMRQSGRDGDSSRVWTYKDLADKFGVSQTLVSMIVKRKCWKHI